MGHFTLFHLLFKKHLGKLYANLKLMCYIIVDKYYIVWKIKTPTYNLQILKNY